MKPRATPSALALLAAAAFTAPSSAEPLEEALKAQKNGMWEIRVGAQAKPALFCVTDSTKLDGLKQFRESARQMGCKVEKQSFQKDGKYELAYACENEAPELGTYRLVMKGTARPDAQSGMTTLSGGGPLLQKMFPSGQKTAVEGRWVRPCNPGEKPGAQGDGALVPVGGYPGMQGVPGQPGLGMPPGQGMPAGMEILPDGE